METSYFRFIRNLFLLLYLIFLFASIPFLHDHSDSIFESDECPAYLIQLFLLCSSITGCVFSDVLFLPSIAFIKPLKNEPACLTEFKNFFNRAPPVSKSIS